MKLSPEKKTSCSLGSWGLDLEDLALPEWSYIPNARASFS